MQISNRLTRALKVCPPMSDEVGRANFHGWYKSEVVSLIIQYYCKFTKTSTKIPQGQINRLLNLHGAKLAVPPVAVVSWLAFKRNQHNANYEEIARNVEDFVRTAKFDKFNVVDFVELPLPSALESNPDHLWFQTFEKLKREKLLRSQARVRSFNVGASVQIPMPGTAECKSGSSCRIRVCETDIGVPDTSGRARGKPRPIQGKAKTVVGQPSPSLLAPPPPPSAKPQSQKPAGKSTIIDISDTDVSMDTAPPPKGPPKGKGKEKKLEIEGFADVITGAFREKMKMQAKAKAMLADRRKAKEAEKAQEEVEEEVEEEAEQEVEEEAEQEDEEEAEEEVQKPSKPSKGKGKRTAKEMDDDDDGKLPNFDPVEMTELDLNWDEDERFEGKIVAVSVYFVVGLSVY